jgi:hypothetical protein
MGDDPNSDDRERTELVNPWMTLWLPKQLLALCVIALLLLIGSAVLEDRAKLTAFWDDPKFWSEMLRDVAVTLGIAVAVIISIEKAARQQLESLLLRDLHSFRDAANAKMTEAIVEITAVRDVAVKELELFREIAEKALANVAADVFNEVLFRRFPKSIGDEIHELVLKADFFRHDYLVTFEMKMKQATPRDPKVPPVNVMEISTTMRYEIENIALQPKDYEIVVQLEDAPVYPIVETPMQIEQVTVDGALLSLDAIDLAQERLIFKHLVKDIQPGQRKKISTKFRMIKSLDDYEIWTSLTPGDGMRIIVYFPPNLTHWGAFEIHRKKVTIERGGQSAVLRLEGPILPEQGLVLWWRYSEVLPSA